MGQINLSGFMNDVLTQTGKPKPKVLDPGPKKKEWAPPSNPLKVPGEGVEVDGDVLAPVEEAGEEVQKALTTPSTPVVQQVKVPYGPLRHLDPKQIHSRLQLIEQLNKGVPLNEYGMPLFFYRPDVLDYTKFGGLSNLEALSQSDVSDMQAMLESAIVPLTYDEGFPTLPSGIPFWSHLDYESKDAQQAFMNYLELGGARQIHMLTAWNLDELRDWFHLNHWKSRVQAFDLYRIANHQRHKLTRLLQVEEDHYTRANKLLKKMDAYFEKVDVLDPETVTPDKAIRMMAELMKIERMSVGLGTGAEKGVDSDRSRQPADVEVILRSVNSNGPRKNNTGLDEFDLLREDPQSIDMAQELIIRLGNQSGFKKPGE